MIKIVTIVLFLLLEFSNASVIIIPLGKAVSFSKKEIVKRQNSVKKEIENIQRSIDGNREKIKDLQEKQLLLDDNINNSNNTINACKNLKDTLNESKHADLGWKTKKEIYDRYFMCISNWEKAKNNDLPKWTRKLKNINDTIKELSIKIYDYKSDIKAHQTNLQTYARALEMK